MSVKTQYMVIALCEVLALYDKKYTLVLFLYL